MNTLNVQKKRKVLNTIVMIKQKSKRLNLNLNVILLYYFFSIIFTLPKQTLNKLFKEKTLII